MQARAGTGGRHGAARGRRSGAPRTAAATRRHAAAVGALRDAAARRITAERLMLCKRHQHGRCCQTYQQVIAMLSEVLLRRCTPGVLLRMRLRSCCGPPRKTSALAVS